MSQAYEECQDWGPDDYREFLHRACFDDAVTTDRFSEIASECNDCYGTDL